MSLEKALEMGDSPVSFGQNMALKVDRLSKLFESFVPDYINNMDSLIRTLSRKFILREEPFAHSSSSHSFEDVFIVDGLYRYITVKIQSINNTIQCLF